MSTAILEPIHSTFNEFAPIAEDPALEDELTRVSELLSGSQHAAAMTRMKEIARLWPESQKVSHWMRILAPVKARTVPQKRSLPRDREIAWIRANGRHYPGQWLALLGDALIAADLDLGKVLSIVRQTPQGEDAILHLQPGSESWIRKPSAGAHDT